jgi:hypothetical protein
MLSLMEKYLDSHIVLPTDGPTSFGVPEVKLAYTDIGNQTQEFRDTLKYFVKYGILAPRPKFE